MFDRRVLLTILVLLAASGVVLAAQTQTNGVPQMPQLPAMPTALIQQQLRRRAPFRV